MIIFRCDANPTIGLGHLLRCQALADAFVELGETCCLVGPSDFYKEAINGSVFKSWISINDWTTEELDAETLCDIAKENDARMLVIDDYRAGLAYQRVIKRRGLKWLQFVHLRDLACEPTWVAYANPNAKKILFCEGNVKKNTRFLGPRYAVLRREFWGAKKIKKPEKYRDPIRRILCVFGGGDDRGCGLYTLKEIDRLGQNKKLVTIVAGRDNPRVPEISNYCSRRPHINLIVDPDSMAEVIREHDLAITSGGTLTYELAAFGVPMLIIAISENQVAASAWEDMGVAVYAGTFSSLSDGALAAYLSDIFNSGDRYFSMQEHLRSVNCGNGAMHIARAVTKGYKYNE